MRKKPDGSGAPDLLLRTKADVFEVTPAGGQFKSSVDPNVSIYFPVQAVDDIITVHMQVVTRHTINKHIAIHIFRPDSTDLLFLRSLSRPISEKQDG